MDETHQDFMQVSRRNMMGMIEPVVEDERPPRWLIFHDAAIERDYQERTSKTRGASLRRALALAIVILVAIVIVMYLNDAIDLTLLIGLSISAVLAMLMIGLTYSGSVLIWVPYLTVAFPYTAVVLTFGFHYFNIIADNVPSQSNPTKEDGGRPLFDGL